MSPTWKPHPTRPQRRPLQIATNNKVRLIVRRAYGFDSADAAVALVMLGAGPINLELPHQRTAVAATPTHGARQESPRSRYVGGGCYLLVISSAAGEPRRKNAGGVGWSPSTRCGERCAPAWLKRRRSYYVHETMGADAVKVLLHDFAGHPFPAQLARALASRGDDVDHAYCSGVETGRGDLTHHQGDPASLRFSEISADRFERYSPVRRMVDEVRYGRRLAAHVHRTTPDVILSGNTPLIAQMLLWRAAGRASSARVYWVQDFLGTGTHGVLRDRSAILGATVGRAFEKLETRLLQSADGAIVIAEDFATELQRRGVRVPWTIVRNWAPLNEIPIVPKDNPWSRAHGLENARVALYAGTLGLKHDPDHLVVLARALRDSGHRLVVATEGRGREYIEAARSRENLEGALVLVDYVDYAELPALLGSADVCLVLLEAEAGRFSVPSKILAYLAAGKAIVAAVPAENLSARTLDESRAGVRVEPGNHEGFARAVVHLLEQPNETRRRGAAARAYAEQTFDIEFIATTIRRALEAATGP
ncbi:MAG: glycosyltransferase family 4 protein [Solirubrobacterales bacterium]